MNIVTAVRDNDFTCEQTAKTIVTYRFKLNLYELPYPARHLRISPT